LLPHVVLQLPGRQVVMPHLLAVFFLMQSVSAFLQASSRFAQSCVPHTPVLAQEAGVQEFDLLHAGVQEGDLAAF